MRYLFLPELKKAEERGMRREVLEYMLERTMDYCAVSGTKLQEGFRDLQAGAGTFMSFYVSSMRDWARAGADRRGQHIDTITDRLRALGEMEFEINPYKLAATNGEARELMLEMVEKIDELREFGRQMSNYPDIAAVIDAAAARAEENPYHSIARSFQAASRLAARG